MNYSSCRKYYYLILKDPKTSRVSLKLRLLIASINPERAHKTQKLC